MIVAFCPLVGELLDLPMMAATDVAIAPMFWASPVCLEGGMLFGRDSAGDDSRSFVGSLVALRCGIPGTLTVAKAIVRPLRGRVLGWVMGISRRWGRVLE